MPLEVKSALKEAMGQVALHLKVSEDVPVGATLQRLRPHAQYLEMVEAIPARPDNTRPEFEPLLKNLIGARKPLAVGDVALCITEARPLVVPQINESVCTYEVVIDHVLDRGSLLYLPFDRNGKLPDSPRDVAYVLSVFAKDKSWLWKDPTPKHASSNDGIDTREIFQPTIPELEGRLRDWLREPKESLIHLIKATGDPPSLPALTDEEAHVAHTGTEPRILGEIVESLKVEMPRLGIAMLGIRERGLDREGGPNQKDAPASDSNMEPLFEGWFQRAMLVDVDLVIDQRYRELRDAAENRSLATKARDRYASLLHDVLVLGYPSEPAIELPRAPATLPSTPGGRFVEVCLPVPVTSDLGGAVQGFVIVFGRVDVGGPFLREGTSPRADAVTRSMTKIIQRIFEHAPKSPSARHAAEDVARSVLGLFLTLRAKRHYARDKNDSHKQTTLQSRQEHMEVPFDDAPMWVVAGIEAVRAAAGFGPMPLDERDGLLEASKKAAIEMQDLVDALDPNYTAAYRLGREYALAQDVASRPHETGRRRAIDLEGSLPPEVRGHLYRGRVVGRLREVVRRYVRNTSVTTSASDPPTASSVGSVSRPTARQAGSLKTSSSSDLFETPVEHRSQPLFLSWDNTSGKLWDKGVDREAAATLRLPAVFETGNLALTLTRHAGVIKLMLSASTWAATTHFEPVSRGVAPLVIVVHDRRAVARALQELSYRDSIGRRDDGVVLRRPEGTAVALEQHLRECDESGDPRRSLAIDLAAVFHNGGLFTHPYAQYFNKPGKFGDAARGFRLKGDYDTGVDRWFATHVLPDCRNTALASLPDKVLHAVTALVRPEGFREHGVDPALIIPGTIRVGGLKRYVREVLLFARHSSSGSIMIIEVYAARDLLGVSGQLDLDAPRRSGLLAHAERRRDVEGLVEKLFPAPQRARIIPTPGVSNQETVRTLTEWVKSKKPTPNAALLQIVYKYIAADAKDTTLGGRQETNNERVPLPDVPKGKRDIKAAVKLLALCMSSMLECEDPKGRVPYTTWPLEGEHKTTDKTVNRALFRSRWSSWLDYLVKTGFDNTLVDARLTFLHELDDYRRNSKVDEGLLEK